MPSYTYTQVTEPFVQGLAESVLAGRSALLIGPRYGGKTNVLEELDFRLRTETKNITVCSIGLTDRDAANEQDLCRILSDGLPGPLRSSLRSFKRTDELFEHLPQRMILLASNVDVIAQPMAQQFLHAVESSAENGRLVAILTAEGDVRELLGGAKNEFRIAQRYFLQGLDRRKFEERLRAFLNERFSSTKIQLATKVDIDEEALSLMFDETGGNAYMGRLLLGRILGLSAERPKSERERFKSGAIDRRVIAEEIVSVKKELTWRDPLIVHAVIQINQDSSCCRNLDDLLRQDYCEVSTSDATLGPTTLELAGVAARPAIDSVVSSGTEPTKLLLKFTCPLMRSFMQTHFDRIRIGDLYVQAGHWDRAIECYESAPMRERIRPRNSYDRVRADQLIRTLCSELHLSASQGSDGAPVRRVDNLFADYCRYVLGFDEVSMLLWNPDETNEGWRNITSLILVGSCKPADKPRVALDKETVHKLIEMLPQGDRITEGPIDVMAFRSFATGVALKGTHPRERVVVILSDFANRTPISPTRRQLLGSLIEHYVKAREHAGDVEADKLRIYVLQKYHEINRFIGERLQAERMNVSEVLKFVAEQITELGYRRFAAAYYSRPEKKIICGVYRCQDQIADTSGEWPPEIADVQLATAERGETKRFLDKEGYAFWVIPLRPRTLDGVESDVTHTFTVQRSDYREISRQEQEDLTEFGRQLLQAIQESERIILLQSTLKHMIEPVVVVDPDKKLRYANIAMAKLFSLSPTEWASPLSAPGIDSVLKDVGAARICALLTGSLHNKELTEQVLGGLGTSSGFYGRMRSGAIHNSRGRVIGAYLHVQNLSEYNELLSCINALIDLPTVEALYKVLLAIPKPCPGWRRLYRIDPRNPNVLLGAAAEGPPSEQRDLFTQGKLAVNRVPGAEYSWFCLERRLPVLFQYTDKRTRRTQYQVPVEAVPNFPWQGLLKKEPGELWLDVPLIGRTEVGKISMQCNDQVRPEDIEFWRIVGAVAALVLENLERESEKRQTAALAAERVFLASMAHNLHTRIASLDPLTDRYELYAEQSPSPKLEELNKQLRRTLAMLQEVFGKVKRHLGTLRVEATTFDLTRALRRLIAERGLADLASVTSEPDPIILTGDEHLIEGLFSELLQNSGDVLDHFRQLAISVEMKTFATNGAEWVRIDYRDKGPGIPDEMKRKIFNLFFTHRTNGSIGTGLGLYFAQRVVLAHGGIIEENGIPGEGARFIVDFPVLYSPDRS